MTSVLYFLHLNTLDILLLIVQQFFVVVNMTKRRKNQSEAYFNLLFIYFITVNKYRFCISVIGYINMQIIGIGYKKSISVDHYLWPNVFPVTSIECLFTVKLDVHRILKSKKDIFFAKCSNGMFVQMFLRNCNDQRTFRNNAFFALAKRSCNMF